MGLPIIPLLAIGALALTACAKAVKHNNGKQPLATLAGSEWGPENGLDQFVNFKSEGELAGYAGCNNFFGTYKQDGNTLKIGPLASTKRACPDLGAEQAFLTALQSARSFEATHMEIKLKNEDGRTALAMRRRDWD